MQDGLSSSKLRVEDVAVNVPSSSILKTIMYLSFIHAASRRFPSGVIMKLRGCLPVLAYPIFSNVPSSIVLKMEIPSFS